MAEGKVESVVDGVISIHGHSIKVPDTLIIQGYASAQAFLAAAVGLELEVKGVMESGVFVATRIELESESDSAEGQHKGPAKGPAPRERRLPGVDHDAGDHHPGAIDEDVDHEVPPADADGGAGVDPEFSVPAVPALL